jgi:hypothetical protein
MEFHLTRNFVLALYKIENVLKLKFHLYSFFNTNI